MAKDAENLATDRAVTFYWTLKHWQEEGLIGFVIVVALPLAYVLQDGVTAGLWFLGASLVGTLSYLWKPTLYWNKVLKWNPEFKKIVVKHMKEAHSGSKSQVFSILLPVYALAIMLVFPSGYSGPLPNGPEVMLLWSSAYAFTLYFVLEVPVLFRASNLKKLSKSFNASEKSLIKRVKIKFLAPPTFSSNILAAMFYAIGTVASLYGVVWMIYWLTGTPDPIFGAWRSGAEGVSPSLMLIMFGPATLYVGRKLRKMDRMGGAMALALAVGTALCLSLLMPILGQLGKLPQPLPINLIWVLGIPFIICILVWRNWGKMRWRREFRMFFGKTAKQEKEGSEER